MVSLHSTKYISIYLVPLHNIFGTPPQYRIYSNELIVSLQIIRPSDPKETGLLFTRAYDKSYEHRNTIKCCHSEFKAVACNHQTRFLALQLVRKWQVPIFVFSFFALTATTRHLSSNLHVGSLKGVGGAVN